MNHGNTVTSKTSRASKPRKKGCTEEITGSSSKETEACGKDRQRNQPSKGFHLIGKDGQDMFETFTLTELASSISSCGVTGAHMTD